MKIRQKLIKGLAAILLAYYSAHGLNPPKSFPTYREAIKEIDIPAKKNDKLERIQVHHFVDENRNGVYDIPAETIKIYEDRTLKHGINVR